MENLTANSKISQIVTVTAGAAAQTAIKSATIDMADYESVTVIVPFGTIVSGAATSIKLQGAPTDVDGDFADLEGTSQTVVDTADNTTFFVELVKPQSRYVRLYVTRTTQDVTLGAVYAIQINGRVKPATHGTGVSGELHVSPAEGTA
jgi:hypothetical protein